MSQKKTYVNVQPDKHVQLCVHLYPESRHQVYLSTTVYTSHGDPHPTQMLSLPTNVPQLRK